MQTAARVGVVSLLASFALGFSKNDNLEQFLLSYLVAFMWILAICLGGLWWVTLQHLVNAHWSIVVRRVGELFAASDAAGGVLSLPIVVTALMRQREPVSVGRSAGGARRPPAAAQVAVPEHRRSS